MLGKGTWGIVETCQVKGMACACKKVKSRPEQNKEYGIPSVFVREVVALKQLSHPNIVALVDVELNVQAKTYNLILALAKCDLVAFIKDSQFDPKPLLFDIAQGLRYLEEKNIYHSDVKPGNILIFERDEGLYQAVVADFGHCSIDDAKPSLISTKIYRAPEVHLATGNFRTKPSNIGFATMVWSFGCILYAMYEKCKPFTFQDQYKPLGAVIDIGNRIGVTKEEESRIVLDYPFLYKRFTHQKRTVCLPEASADLLLSNCLKFNPRERISLQAICECGYFEKTINSKPIATIKTNPEYARDHEAVRFLRPFMGQRRILAKVAALYDRVIAHFAEVDKEQLAVACFSLFSKVYFDYADLREICDECGFDEDKIAALEERILKITNYNL